LLEDYIFTYSAVVYYADIGRLNPGLTLITIGTILFYAESQQIVTNISLIGIGCVVLVAIFLMTDIILFSIVTVVSEKSNSSYE